MNSEVKRFADAGDVKALKYIFVDALDVDPTFVKYEDDFNYCKSMNLLEKHKELTPFLYDERKWNTNYWVALKRDLLNNFSEQRMSHMREVAKYYLSEKIKKITAERESNIDVSSVTEDKAKISENKEDVTNNSSTSFSQFSTLPTRVEQERMLAEKRRKQAEEYEAAKKEEARVNEELHNKFADNKKKSNDTSKKAIGVAIAAVAVTAIVVYLLLQNGNA